MPLGLDPLTRREWRRLAPVFVGFGILTPGDGMAFESLCTAYATFRRINQALKKCKYQMLAEKHTIDGAGNEHIEVKANPLVVQQRLAMQTLRFMCQEFGATPSSRGKIQVVGERPVDPEEDFLNGR